MGEPGQIGIGHDHEEHAMAFEQPPEALDHDLRAGRIGEIGKDHDQRAALQPGGQRGHREGEIGLLHVIVERRRAALKLRKSRGAPRTAKARGPGGKPEDRHAILRLERHPGRGQRGGHRPVEPGQSGQRLGHRLPAIEGEHDLVVALGLVFLGEQAAMARRERQSIRRRSMPGS
jgi:hypothetical protein